MSRAHLVQKVLSIPADDARWFEENYSEYGAWTWWVRTSLRTFRELHETTPVELIRETQQEMVTHLKEHGVTR